MAGNQFNILESPMFFFVSRSMFWGPIYGIFETSNMEGHLKIVGVLSWDIPQYYRQSD